MNQRKIAQVFGEASEAVGDDEPEQFTAPAGPITDFFFNDTATTEIYTVPYTLSPTRRSSDLRVPGRRRGDDADDHHLGLDQVAAGEGLRDRKSTRLNSSHTEQSRMPSSA